MIFTGRTACAGGILRSGVLRTPIGLMRGKAARRQEKGEGRSGALRTSPEFILGPRFARTPGDEPTTQKNPAPSGLRSGGRPRCRGARPMGTASLFTPLLADRARQNATQAVLP